MRRAILIAACLAGLATGAPTAFAGGPASDRCGELLPGGTANTPDPVRAGPAAPQQASVAAATAHSSWRRVAARAPSH